MTKIFLIVDEVEIAKQKYISVLVGSLDAPNQTFLVDCHPLVSGSNVNSKIILHTENDISRQLEIKLENFSLFLTDAAFLTTFSLFLTDSFNVFPAKDSFYNSFYNCLWLERH